MKKYILEITVFICGAVVMIFELVGSRILAPYLGTSTFVWTSIIGVILGSLSIGYALGGKIADKRTNIKILSMIIFASAMYIIITIFTKDITIIFLHKSFTSIKSSSVLASIILFAPTSILLGMVSPYAIKLKLKDLNNSGSMIGNLYALSTVGSIFGTFFSGFYLIPAFGITKILMILSLVLVLLSVTLSVQEMKKIKTSFVFMVGILWISNNSISEIRAENGFIDLDTKYNHVIIKDYTDEKTGEPARGMMISNESSSSMFLNSDNLVFEYTKYYDLVKHFNPDFKRSLTIGGAAYSYPKHYLKTYPDKTISVVEIDPDLTELAKKYFNLKEDPRLSIFHEDGRVFLNNTSDKYDAIFGDAFKSQCSIPYQLTTHEAIQKQYNILNDNGVVILNIISSINGKNGEFLRAEYATFKNIFPQVHLFLTRDKDPNKTQNIILIAVKSDKKFEFTNKDPELNKYLSNIWTGDIPEDMPIITDDHAPVDHYTNKMIN